MGLSEDVRIVATADVDQSAQVGPGTTVWHLAQVRSGADVGAECVIGRGAFVDAGVVVGRACKIQNYALVYAPARLEEGVFVGPAAVLTNDVYPRAIEPDGTPKRAGDWQPQGVEISRGASIGASATVLAGVTVGAWATVAAGAVVTSSVPAHALMVGTPARRVGWVGPAGVPLRSDDDGWRCPVEGRRFAEVDGVLEEQP